MLDERGGGIQNNLFYGGSQSIIIWALLGTVFNNVLIEAENAALWDSNYGRNPVEYGYNSFWNNNENYYDFNPGIGDIYEDPLLNLEGGYLEEGSPCIDTGNPEILDLDGTRSDIGPFGGPWAYN